jgi:MFS family permease
MMRIPTVWWTNISAMLFGFGMYSVMIVVPSFLQTPSSAGYGFGASITESGFALLPLSAAMLVAGILTGAFATRYGSKVPLVVGSALSALGMLFLTVAHDSEWNFYVAKKWSVFGEPGIGFAFSAMSNRWSSGAARSDRVATGMNANVRTIGGAIGSQIVARSSPGRSSRARCRRRAAASSPSSCSASRSCSRASRRPVLLARRAVVRTATSSTR